MVRREVRPRKARLLGSILPNHTKFMESATYEDFGVIRTDGSNVTFKELNSTTMNLNIDVAFSELSVTASDTTVNHTNTVSVTLLADNTPVSGEKVNINIDGDDYTATTNTNGVATVTSWKSNTVRTNVPVTVKYLGNTTKKLSDAEPVSTTFNVTKNNVTLTIPNTASGIVTETSNIPITLKDSSGTTPIIGIITIKDSSGVTVQTIDLSTDSNPTINVRLADLGTSVYNISYDGGGAYENKTGSISITTTKKTATLSATDSTSIIMTETSNITVTIKDGSTNIKQGQIRVKDSNGNVIQTINPATDTMEIRVTPTVVGKNTYTIEYVDTKYTATSKTITITTKQIDVWISCNIPGNGYIDENIFSTFGVSEDTNEMADITTGKLQIKTKSGTVIKTFNLPTTLEYNHINNVSETVEYVLVYTPDTQKYKSKTLDYAIIYEKRPVELSITGDKIVVNPTGDTSFNVKIVDSLTNELVETGNVQIQFDHYSTGITSDVGTFSVSNYTGNMNISRRDLLLDDLFRKMQNANYLFYTGYTVTATFNGGTRYQNSSISKQSFGLRVWDTLIKPVWTISDSNDYNIINEYPEVPNDDTSLAYYHIRVNPNTSDIRTIFMNRVTSEPILGTVKKKQYIYFAFDLFAFYVNDNQRKYRESQYYQITPIKMGGIKYDVNFIIDDNEEQDATQVQLNGNVTSYTTPRYVKMSIPNWDFLTEKYTVVLYFGRNSNYYNLINGDSDYGLRIPLIFELEA